MSTLLRDPPSAKRYSYSAAVLAAHLQAWLEERPATVPNTLASCCHWGKNFFEKALGGIDKSKQTEPTFAWTPSSSTILCIVFALEPAHGAQHTFDAIDAYLHAGHACLDDISNAKERTPDLVEKVRIYQDFFHRLYLRGSSDHYSEYMRRSHDPDDE